MSVLFQYLMRRSIRLLPVVFFILSPLAVYAQEVTEAEVVEAAEEPFFKPQTVVFRMFGGTIEFADEPQLPNRHDKYAFFIGVGGDLEAVPYLGLDVELGGLSSDFTNPLGSPWFGSISDDTNIDMFGVLVGLRAFYPAQSALRFYVVGGLGWFQTTMRTYGSLFGFPGSYEDKDMALEFYHGAGLRLGSDQWALTLDYRRINPDSDFPDYGIENVGVGGDMTMIGFEFGFY